MTDVQQPVAEITHEDLAGKVADAFFQGGNRHGEKFCRNLLHGLITEMNGGFAARDGKIAELTKQLSEAQSKLDSIEAEKETCKASAEEVSQTS